MTEEFEFTVAEHDFEDDKIGTEAFAAQQSSTATTGTTQFVTVAIRATPAQRVVAAAGYLNGQLVCTATAADQTVSGVISSASQSFTMPVPPGVTPRIRTNLSNPAGHVIVRRFRA